METTLESLNLTEKDFELLVDGLDNLPNKGQTGEFMVDMLGTMMMKDDESRDKFERERELKKKKNEREKALMIEDIKILQGKLLMFKRFLKEKNILIQVDELTGNR